MYIMILLDKFLIVYDVGIIITSFLFSYSTVEKMDLNNKLFSKKIIRLPQSR